MGLAWRRLIPTALLPLAMAGCGMAPYQNPDHREEGPKQGLLTGPEGEWVIYRKQKSAQRRNGTHADTDRGDTAADTPPEAPPSLE